MMSRVALGHTGRNVFEPSRLISWAFIFLVLSAIVRVILPMLDMNQYMTWIGISQMLWILAFAIFVYIYTRMLIAPRVDSHDG